MTASKINLGILLMICAMLTSVLSAQTEGVSIKSNPSAPHGSAMLDVESSSKGILIPRVPLTNLTSTVMMATAPSSALLVFNSTTNATVTPGFYYWTGSVWKQLATGPELWKLIGTGPNIHYNGGKVTVGNAPSSTQEYNLEVLTNAGSSVYSCKFETAYGGQLRYAYTDTDVGGAAAGPGNWLTQKSASVAYGGTVWCQPNIFSMVGGATTFTNSPNVDNRGLVITSWPKVSGTKGSISMYGNINDLNISTNGTLSASYPGGVATLTTGGVWSPSSDSTLKRNIQDETSVLARIADCRPVTYRYKSEPDGQLCHGFLAQEIESVFPELVVGIKLESGTETIEGVGTKQNYVEKKGLNYTGLISVLLKAIQEQQAQISDLTGRIQTLEQQ